jgi:xanthine dehydrogenase YagS FAD-binding subunit
MKPFEYAIAETEAGAVAALAGGWKPKGSGVDLVDLLKERLGRFDKLVSLHEVASLKAITSDGTTITIGAGATLQEIADNADVRAACHAVAHAAGDAATPQIRAVATAAGNLCQRPRCWYFRNKEYDCLKKRGSTCYAVEGENRYHALFGGGPCHVIHPSNLAGPLVAAGAEIVLKKAGGERVVPAADFFVLPSASMYAENVAQPDELLTEIRLPARKTRSGYTEFREKQSFDWPLASCSAVHDGTKWNVVLGHVAPVPWRAKAAEAVLAGATSITPELALKAGEAALEGAEPMSQNAWRLHLVRAAVHDALMLADGKEIR